MRITRDLGDGTFSTDKGTDGERVRWALYEPSTNDDDIRAEWPEASYNGPGRYFSHAPTITRKGSRVLVKQYTALDI